MELADLKEIDSLREVSLGSCQCFLHTDHRWVLPIIHDAQERGVLSKPCTLVMFDAHHDAKAPNCMHDITHLRKNGVTLDSLMSLCQEKLSRLDDDWVQAATQLGLVGDVAIFGCAHSLDDSGLRETEDCCGTRHRIELVQPHDCY